MEKASNLKQEMTKSLLIHNFEVLETSQLCAVKGGNCKNLVGDKRRRRTS
jgi:hypothetical protein